MTDRQALYNNLNDLFDSFCSSKGIDPEHEKITTNRYNSIMMYLYENYVNTLEINMSYNIKKYSHIDFINLVEWYISKSLYLDIVSLYGFCLLVNRSMNWLNGLKYADAEIIQKSFIFDVCITNDNNSYINCGMNDINNNIEAINNSLVSSNRDSEAASLPIMDALQKLFETLTQSTVNKLNDSTIGLVTNANNNKDVGLMYAKERIQEQAKARQTIELADLPLLE